MATKRRTSDSFDDTGQPAKKSQGNSQAASSSSSSRRGGPNILAAGAKGREANTAIWHAKSEARGKSLHEQLRLQGKPAVLLSDLTIAYDSANGGIPFWSMPWKHFATGNTSFTQYTTAFLEGDLKKFASLMAAVHLIQISHQTPEEQDETEKLLKTMLSGQDQHAWAWVTGLTGEGWRAIKEDDASVAQNRANLVVQSARKLPRGLLRIRSGQTNTKLVDEQGLRREMQARGGGKAIWDFQVGKKSSIPVKLPNFDFLGHVPHPARDVQIKLGRAFNDILPDLKKTIKTLADPKASLAALSTTKLILILKALREFTIPNTHARDMMLHKTEMIDTILVILRHDRSPMSLTMEQVFSEERLTSFKDISKEESDKLKERGMEEAHEGRELGRVAAIGRMVLRNRPYAAISPGLDKKAERVRLQGVFEELFPPGCTCNLCSTTLVWDQQRGVPNHNLARASPDRIVAGSEYLLPLLQPTCVGCNKFKYTDSNATAASGLLAFKGSSFILTEKKFLQPTISIPAYTMTQRDDDIIDSFVDKHYRSIGYRMIANPRKVGDINKPFMRQLVVQSYCGNGLSMCESGVIRPLERMSFDRLDPAEGYNCPNLRLIDSRLNFVRGADKDDTHLAGWLERLQAADTDHLNTIVDQTSFDVLSQQEVDQLYEALDDVEEEDGWEEEEEDLEEEEEDLEEEEEEDRQRRWTSEEEESEEEEVESSDDDGQRRWTSEEEDSGEEEVESSDDDDD